MSDVPLRRYIRIINNFPARMAVQILAATHVAMTFLSLITVGMYLTRRFLEVRPSSCSRTPCYLVHSSSGALNVSHALLLIAVAKSLLLLTGIKYRRSNLVRWYISFGVTESVSLGLLWTFLTTYGFLDKYAAAVFCAFCLHMMCLPLAYTVYHDLLHPQSRASAATSSRASRDDLPEPPTAATAESVTLEIPRSSTDPVN